MSHRRRRRRQQPQDWLTAEAAAAAAPPTRLWPPTRRRRPPPPTTTTTTTTPEATTGPAMTWRLGDYEPSQPFFRHYTERFLQPRRLDPSSLGAWHHRHIQLQRHCGVSSGSDTPRVRDTNAASATHSERTNNTATHRSAADRRSGCSTCKQSQQPTLVDQSETRRVSDLGPSSPRVDR